MTQPQSTTTAAGTASLPPSWQYRACIWDPDRDGEEEDWAGRMAGQGWRTWLDSSGAWVSMGGRRVRVWSLRRPCRHPFSVHDHSTKCVTQTRSQ